VSPPVDRIDPATVLPKRADVVIIGGGIAGVSTALFLSQKGISVTLCEKGHIGAEQSSRNWGWCRTQSRDPRELPLSMESLRLWRKMNTLVEGETGFRQCGILSLSADEAEQAAGEEWVRQARLYQHDGRVLSPEEADALAPGSSRRWHGGLYTPSDGRAEPSKAAPAIARGAQRLGATILTECAVRGVETKGGRVSGVVTERGRIDCDAVVLAGGAWSSLMCNTLGLRLPQLKVLASVQRTAPLEGGPEVSARGPGFGIRKRMDGGYTIAYGLTSISEITPDSFRYLFDFLPRFMEERKTVQLRIGRRFWDEWRQSRPWKMDEVSPFEKVRVLDPQPRRSQTEAARRHLQAAFPVFEKMQVLERWAGLIDVTPDAVPVISGIDSIPGLFLSTGYSGHGFGLGPGAGRLTAQLVMGETPIVDTAPFSFARFGRKPVLKKQVMQAADAAIQV
jgi:glycine/D-amino acid oxidase-like deaminating enzyme